MKDFTESKLDFFQFFKSIEQIPKKINALAGIRMYWWENFSKIDKRTGTTISDSRVDI